MNLYVERSDDGLIVRDGNPGDVLARRTTINPLRAGLDGVEGPGRSIVWSGTLDDFGGPIGVGVSGPRSRTSEPCLGGDLSCAAWDGPNGTDQTVCVGYRVFSVLFAR